jgi:energy-coupling factor transport system permease protein
MSLADLTIGRYFPAESVIHEIDVRIKLISVVVLTAAIFIASSFYALLFSGLFVFMIYILCKLPWKWLYKAVKPVFYLLIIAFIFQAFFTPGRIIYKLAFIRLTYEGVTMASFVVARVLIVVVLGSVLTFTTQPIEIADGLESLLKPLKWLKLPVHEIALTITLAIRFVPELLTEAQKIAFAQEARGADFKSGNIYKRTKSLIPIFIPLIVSSFLKAEYLGKAMESRLYSGSEGRTKLYQSQLKLEDYVSLIVVLAAVTITILIR